jgi:hypothetical protein
VLAPFPLDGHDCFELDADARRLAVAAACGSRRDSHTSSDVVPPRKGDTMQIGLVGLGRMGANMSRRWLRDGHTVVGYARHAGTVNGLVADKAISAGATSLKDLVGQLAAPRVI